jgi:transposase
MVYRKISKDIKERVVLLYQHGWPVEELTEIFDVSAKSIGRWRDIFNNEGDVVRAPSHLQGRPSILTPEMRYELLDILSEDTTLYVEQLKDFFAVERDVAIARSTLQNTLKAMGVTRKKIRKEASERDEAARLEFLIHMRNEYKVDQLVAVDESAKDDRTIYRQFGRALVGSRAVASQPFQREERWSILPALSADCGYLALRIVEGAVDAHQFIDFIVEDVVSTFTAVFQHHFLTLE